ncbi:hypothetical protein [Streptomyces sp. cmx-18-6]|uniref:hypothetical protein n=1 Tax=Streptomyces sp. cmx-18-6 TaxID=2790930 RepID=UPI00397F749C
MTDNPIAYGYVRVRPDVDEEELRLVENELGKYAEAHGLELDCIHYEDGPGIRPGRLVRRLLRNGVRHVIVPSLAQITEHRIVGESVEEAIEWDAGAVLHETREHAWRADGL